MLTLELLLKGKESPLATHSRLGAHLAPLE